MDGVTFLKIMTEKLRKMLFFGICLPSRFLLILMFIFFQSFLSIFYVIFFSFLAFGSMLSALMKRKFGLLGQTRWWYSSIHSINYFLFVIFTITEFSLSWFILFADLSFGFISFLFIDSDQIWIQEINLKFGEGDLTNEEKQELEMNEMDESIRNPIKFIITDDKRKQHNSINKV